MSGGGGNRPAAPVIPLAARLPRLDTGHSSEWIRPQPMGAPRPLLQNPPPVAAPPSGPGAAQVPPPPPGLSPEAIREAAEREGLRAAQQKVDATITRYLEAIAHLAERARETSTPPASDVVAVALVVAREILGREAAVDRRLLESSIEEALRAARKGAQVVVRLGRVDFEQAKRRQGVLGESGVELRLDESLGPGGGVVEAPDRITDYSIDARLEAVRAAMIEALAPAREAPRGGRPGFGPGDDGRA